MKVFMKAATKLCHMAVGLNKCREITTMVYSSTILRPSSMKLTTVIAARPHQPNRPPALLTLLPLQSRLGDKLFRI